MQRGLLPKDMTSIWLRCSAFLNIFYRDIFINFIVRVKFRNFSGYLPVHFKVKSVRLDCGKNSIIIFVMPQSKNSGGLCMSNSIGNLILCIILAVPLYYFLVLITAYITGHAAFKIIGSTVGKGVKSQINRQLIQRSFNFFILTCIISVFCITLIYSLLVNADLSDFSQLSFRIISIPFLFIYIPLNETLGAVARTASAVISALSIFIFNYFVVLKKITLPKKEKLISALIITACTSPYLFLFSCHGIIEFFGS